MTRPTKDIISMYKAGIEPWKIHHGEAMRDWDDFESMIAHAAQLLETLVSSHHLHDRLAAAGRIPFDPEFEQEVLNGISCVLEDAPVIFASAEQYASDGCAVKGLDEFRSQYQSALAIAQQYAANPPLDDTTRAQGISPDYEELREMMARKPTQLGQEPGS